MTTGVVDALRYRAQAAGLEADRERARGDVGLAMFFDGKAEAYEVAADIADQAARVR